MCGNLLQASCARLGELFLENVAKCLVSGKVDFSLHFFTKQATHSFTMTIPRHKLCGLQCRCPSLSSLLGWNNHLQSNDQVRVNYRPKPAQGCLWTTPPQQRKRQNTAEIQVIPRLWCKGQKLLAACTLGTFPTSRLNSVLRGKKKKYSILFLTTDPISGG